MALICGIRGNFYSHHLSLSAVSYFSTMSMYYFYSHKGPVKKLVPQINILQPNQINADLSSLFSD